MSNPLLNSLLAAVDANPTDVPLRLHVAKELLQHARAADALEHCTVVLQQDSSNADALALLQQASAALSTASAEKSSQTDTANSSDNEFDWTSAEAEVSDFAVPPPFVTEDDHDDAPALDFESTTITLADVGGLEAVKQRLDIAFLGPMRNPDLAKAYGKSLRGGLMLYGPPGCGKTYIARAIAGELGAKFTALSLADILSHYHGGTERNIKEIFNAGRRSAPCVLFFDEVDAIGLRRSKLGSGESALRTAINQLLTELDSVGSNNDGLFVLAATNHPWDVDSALRRPGRFDRTLLVLPPDREARITILRQNLANRPIAGINLDDLAQRAEDFSGADLAHLCETAAEFALADSLQSGTIRPISMSDLDRAFSQVKPSTSLWLETARNVALFANSSGEYDELADYLKTRNLL